MLDSEETNPQDSTASSPPQAPRKKCWTFFDGKGPLKKFRNNFGKNGENGLRKNIFFVNIFYYYDMLIGTGAKNYFCKKPGNIEEALVFQAIFRRFKVFPARETIVESL
jgi:hypothetical protein